MSKQTPKRRSFEIRKRQKRRKKLKKLKEKYLAAKTKEEKEKIIEKILRLAPTIDIEEWLKK
jgi:hypothetical protein